MHEQKHGKLQETMTKVVTVGSGVSMLLAFLIVIPATLWFAWTHRTTTTNSILTTLFCVAFAWLFISLWQCHRILRRLGLDGEGRMRLFAGPRPDDFEELRAWHWGWHFVLAVIAALLCMIAIPVSWSAGK